VCDENQRKKGEGGIVSEKSDRFKEFEFGK